MILHTSKEKACTFKLWSWWKDC